jgi:hypothetical protein
MPALQPQINSGRCIPSRRAIAGAKLHRDVLVAIRDPQWRPGYRIWLGGSAGGFVEGQNVMIEYRCGGLAALRAAARHIDASLAIVGAQRWPDAGPRKYGNVSWTPSRQAD